MSLWIKICGNTSLADALLASEAGADAVGFVFARSPRRVTVEQVAAITPHLPAAAEKVGVFVDAALEEIEAAVRACGLTGVQLHSEAGPEMPGALRRLFGPNLHILRVVHFGAEATEQTAAVAADAHVNAVLVDSRTATAVGGTGVAFDWSDAARTLFQSTEAGASRMIVAGGLNPENVAEAIATLRPWGVDVVSGVEVAPGLKDPRKVREFVARARNA
jgi:phosphoribosylanthranilate isomerase